MLPSLEISRVVVDIYLVASATLMSIDCYAAATLVVLAMPLVLPLLALVVLK